METEGLLLYSVKPETRLHTEPAESSLKIRNLFL
jgi:hypothetical protein